MSKEYPLIVTRFKNKEWKPLISDKLPQNAIDFFESGDIWRSRRGSWLCGSCYYKGATPETATEWIIVLDDGGYYKCFAIYSFWHRSRKGEIVLQCVWSTSHLRKTMRNYIENGDTLPDPGYQT